MIRTSPKMVENCCPVHISHPKIVNRPIMPVIRPSNFPGVIFSPRNLTASRLLHIGIEYRSTDDFPASTKRSPYMTRRKTIDVCRIPTIIRCFQYCLAGKPILRNQTNNNNVAAPVPKRKAENVNGPMYTSPSFIRTQAYPQRMVMSKMSIQRKALFFCKRYVVNLVKSISPFFNVLLYDSSFWRDEPRGAFFCSIRGIAFIAKKTSLQCTL